MLNEAVSETVTAERWLCATRAARIFQELDMAFTPSQRRSLAQVKRFLELAMGDPDARQLVQAGKLNEVVQQHGLDLDPEAMRSFVDPAAAETAAADPSSLLRLWRRRMAGLVAMRAAMRDDARTPEAAPLLDRWRLRQIRRNESEIGHGNNDAIVHPLFAFELSKGCTVGCWFCGIGAERFQGYFAYTPENARLWQEVLQAGVRLVGAAMATSFCYWATDPLDNPHYSRFLEDYYSITGWMPQTTTAAPMRNVALTREVIGLQAQHRAVVSRFSITALKTLHAVHAEFPPEELLDVELVLHHKEANRRKALAGAALRQYEKLKAVGREDSLPLGDAYGTIACVSGFLVNMLDRSIKMVAPCRASTTYPDGYKVYAEATFDGGEEFEGACRSMMETHMPVHPPASQRLAFRRDLAFAEVDGGFMLSNAFDSTTLDGQPFLRELGMLISEGTHSVEEVESALLEQGADVFTIVTTIQSLFDEGLLAEPVDFAHA